MQRRPKQMLVGIYIAIVMTCPLIWLQTHRHIGENLAKGTVEAYGWPYPCRSEIFESNSVTGLAKTSIQWNVPATLANIAVLFFVAVSFGGFVATTDALRLSLVELFVFTMLIALMLAIWTSDASWTNVVVPDKQRDFRAPPVWANYLIFFAIGAAFATIIRAIHRKLFPMPLKRR